MIPITIMIRPTVEISRPEMSAPTAKYKIAPTPIRKSEEPIGMFLDVTGTAATQTRASKCRQRLTHGLSTSRQSALSSDDLAGAPFSASLAKAVSGGTPSVRRTSAAPPVGSFSAPSSRCSMPTRAAFSRSETRSASARTARVSSSRGGPSSRAALTCRAAGRAASIVTPSALSICTGGLSSKRRIPSSRCSPATAGAPSRRASRRAYSTASLASGVGCVHAVGVSAARDPGTAGAPIAARRRAPARSHSPARPASVPARRAGVRSRRSPRAGLSRSGGPRRAMRQRMRAQRGGKFFVRALTLLEGTTPLRSKSWRDRC